MSSFRSSARPKITGVNREIRFRGPARRLLIFASLVTLALNVAEPLVAGAYGKAAFDAVGPLLLIGWSEVGPGLLQAISTTRRMPGACDADRSEPIFNAKSDDGTPEAQPQHKKEVVVQEAGQQTSGMRTPENLLAQARREDTAHRAAHQKPISADTLRVRLGVGAARARRLVKIVRYEFEEQVSSQRPKGDVAGEKQGAAILAA